MACKQEILNLNITGNMIEKAIKSFTVSKRYTQVMLRSTILNILYQRLLLNENDLKIRKYKDIPFVVFKRRSVKDPLLCQYLAWVKGIADAVDKNYLKEVFVFLKNPVNDELVESYRFYLKYNLDENYENRHTTDDLKAATQELLQVICDLGKHAKLSENTDVLLELTYFDTTPDSYQPPGFEDSLSKYCMSAPSCNNHLATLKTGFHKLACYGAGLVFNEKSHTSEILIMTEEQKNEKSECAGALVDKINDNETPTRIGHGSSSKELHISNITVSDHDKNDVSVVSGKSGSVTEDYFNCICQLGVSLPMELISCVSCKKTYHAACHGYLNKEDISQMVFICFCCNTNDQILLQFKKNEWPLLARVRMVLYFMNKYGRFPADVMKLLSENDRNNILEKMEAFNLLLDNNPGKINKVTLKQILSKFFVMDNSQVLL